MKLEYRSTDKEVCVTVESQRLASNLLKVATVPKGAAGRTVSVSVLSNSENVSLSLKPSVIAQEERQERLSRELRLGFRPVSKSTKG